MCPFMGDKAVSHGEGTQAPTQRVGPQGHRTTDLGTAVCRPCLANLHISAFVHSPADLGTAISVIASVLLAQSTLLLSNGAGVRMIGRDETHILEYLNINTMRSQMGMLTVLVRIKTGQRV